MAQQQQQQQQDSARRRLHEEPAHVLQTDFSPGSGNALQACIASLFHCQLDQVPNFVTLPSYQEGIREFVQPNYTCRKVPLPSSSSDDDDVGKLCVLRGKSPRGDFGHVIVARCCCCLTEKNNSSLSFENVWDPHPDGTFLDPTQALFGWYMVFDEQAGC